MELQLTGSRPYYMNELQPWLTIHGERFNKDSSYGGSMPMPAYLTRSPFSHHDALTSFYLTYSYNYYYSVYNSITAALI